ncbi:hypothetical protein AJ79_06938 [Helicocarpus griseus UAMH5409]|uniref:Uncharacterized protein n=1 Tax=Helicocarpus griseus UAMH5409 TaxID=1447875 RepID=A0A2B7X879_9EURO|nr:hypothetical protein AJ79_06938 [Helicocarpus griseus UAMH5409]
MAPRRSSTTTRPGSRGRGRPSTHQADKSTALMSKSPNWLLCLARYAGIILSSLALSTILFSLSTCVTRGDLAWTSRHFNSWWQVGGLLAWRTVELTAAWLLGYDARDVASFMFLIHLPTQLLLSSFYGIRPTTLITVAAITLLSSSLPFLIFRNPSRVHQQHPLPRFCSYSDARASTTKTIATTAKGDTVVKDQPRPTILTDTPTTLYTSLVATAIYTVSLYTSFATWLPTYLVTHFDGLPDLRAVHAGSKGFVSLFLTLLPAGYMLRDFLFVNSVGAAHIAQQDAEFEAEPDKKLRGLRKSEEEERHGELLATTLYRKYWLTLSVKTRELIARTLALAGMVLVNTIVQVVGTISGAEMEGAVGWGLIWTVATGITGWLYWWVQAID